MRLLVLTALLALTACGQALQNGAGPVSLMVEPQTVAPGDSLTLILRNDSPAEIGYNLCSSGLEQNVDGGWRTVPSERVCTMELRMLAPGEVARYPLQLELGLAPGDYRYVTQAGSMEGGDRGPVRSAPFRVTG